MFSRSGNPLRIFQQSYHVWGTSKIQVNFRFKTYSEVLVNVFYRFLKFLDYPCFWGQRIQCWNFYRATMFGWPRKSKLTSGTSNKYPEVLVIVSCRFLKFLHHSCFLGQRTIWWHSYWATMFGRPQNSGHLLVQEVFEVTQTFIPWQKSSKFISSRAKVARRSHDQRFIVNFVVMSRNVMSCHVMPRYATSCHVTVMSSHVMSRHVTSSHVMLRHVT